jgi:hypothetical protein|tara:strand:- start:44 stop:1018 length:975 start_codon:yes stop_codon:yes gene_type:complete
MGNIFYTYAYLRKGDRTPYYIGKGRGKRAYDSSHNVKVPDDKDRIIFLKQNLTEEEAFNHEKYMIAVLGRKDLGTGILRNMSDGGEGHSNPSPEARRKNAESSRLQYQMGIGIGGFSNEERKEYALMAARARLDGQWLKDNPEYNGGSLGRTSEQHSADSAKAIKSGCAKYWKSMTEEERYEKRSKQGKKGGAKNKELGLGICGLSFEERSKISKKKFEDPNVVEKYRQQGKKQYAEGKGFFSPEAKERSRLTNLERTCKEFHVRSPEGKIYKGKGRKPFAREHGLPETSFNNLIRGLNDNCRGWTRVEETEQNSSVDLMQFFE